MHKLMMPILLGATALTAVPAHAQEKDPQVDALIAEIQALRAEVAELRGEVEAGKAAKADTAIKFKATPELSTDDGWKFKVRGRMMYDAATVDAPDAIDDAGLGFSNEMRRGRLGVEGDMPGGFGYKAELEFAGGDAEFTDAYVSYEKGDMEFIVGQHNNFQGLAELTSSLHTQFFERAAFTDAFGFERRVGVSAQYKGDNLLVQGGLFTDAIGDLDENNNSNGVDGRIVFMPEMGGNQLHFGGSAHYRALNDAASSVRYRVRPAVHSTDVRFINTGAIGATSETGLGLEAAGIFGPLYVAGETFWQKVGGSPAGDPTFFGAYLEGGYFLTGESRGYKGGKFDRVKVANGFDKGGIGSIGINARWDYLDLNDAGIVGGTQNAYQASLNWKPVDYVLFGLNFAHIVYGDAAIPAAGDRDYSVNVLGLRGQVDF
ncbi:OprO/OprP family phosphate-selective porin [Sphingomicrobium lutaoense]|uniref:Phosphate-selective porin OprO/OprP n=1 Tax=Sphingomicrobium lutaoense TaxID=515949 RepID=A0A839Z5G0_9SPHN|nr:porin [Sphingomicrobium lutaoense]MBB3764905.1 phosphate-selective porin OprO/OprP [Sphingomicrobium lutaoense]